MIGLNNCSNCGACKSVCPTQSIYLTVKDIGFSYPEIHNNTCIHCGLCDKICPTNNIRETNVNTCYVGYSRNNTRLQCSSGGVFPEIANYILSKNGVVFGSVFDKDWNVIVTYTENDITPMLGSKYVQSDIKNTYKECKDFLDKGRLVLYTGTPCQIYGLKGFLKKEYENLLTVDIFCHGVPSPKIWKHYIKSFNKEIESINFRDKRDGWGKPRITVKFKDGSEMSEYTSENKYMQLFLSDKILRKSCYSCKLRCNSIADISIGDAWAIQTKLNDHKGLSDIVTHTEKGRIIVDSLDLIKEPISYNLIVKTNCINRNWTIPTDRNKYIKQFSTKPKIGIVTHCMHTNVGGILQAFALSEKIKEIIPCDPIFLNQTSKHLSFLDKHCKWTTNSVTDDLTYMIIGSDQIWNPDLKGISLKDRFGIYDNIKKVVYAASFGHHIHAFSNNEMTIIQDALKKIKYISTRELFGAVMVEKWFNTHAVSTLDPTMLYDKDFYQNVLNLSNVAENGIFSYILDKNDAWTNICTKASTTLNEPLLVFDGSCEQFISNFNSARCVITDSYHGSVFSLIFNKPFVCLRNKNRGNDRFDDLCVRFDIENRFVENLDAIDLSLLEEKPNCTEQIMKYRKDSLDFLTKALYDL